jgi:hypothetical protein
MCQTTAALTGSVSYMLATHLTDTHIYFLEAANGRTVDRCFWQDWLVVAGILFKIVEVVLYCALLEKVFPGWH